MTSTSVSARSTPQDLPLRLPTITLLVQGSLAKVYSALHFVWSYLGFHLNPKSEIGEVTLWRTAHSDASPSTSTFGTQVITGIPVTTTYAMTFAPGKSVAVWQVDSVRKAFALQCEVPTAAVTLESKPLDGCPSWDLTSRRRQATTSTKAQVKIFLESFDATRREDLVAAASSASSVPQLKLV